MKVILLDIEGTTTPIDLVHKTLFPYAKAKIGEYVKQNLDDIKTEVSQLRIEYKKDFSSQIYGRDFREDAPETIADYLKFLIEIDRESTPLKSLQGNIWQSGYESGELESVMFADIPKAFEKWKTENKQIAIYSSGSILAQKLIFKYSNFGDLTDYISNYFDTNVGHKRKAESYVKIAAAMNLPPKRLAFVSDVIAELDAARTSGYETFLSIRDGNAQVEKQTKHRVIHSFDEIL